MSWDSWFNELQASLGDLKRVHFRVDAGRVRGLSFGHLERCHILSRLLREQGATTCFFMKPIAEGLQRAQDLGETVRTLDGPWVHDFSQAEGLVVDLPYESEPELVALCADTDKIVLLVDDSGSATLPCTVVLNYSILATAGMYPQAAVHLLGPEYLIKDETFKEAVALASAGEKTIVVTCGGSDPTGLTREVVLTMISREPEEATLAYDLQDYQVVAILGPGYGRSEEIEAAAAASQGRLTVLRSPRHLLPLLATSAAIICAGGKTLYESLALGKPVLAVGTTPHEGLVIQAMKNRGLLTEGLTRWEKHVFIKSINRLMNVVAHD